jgi:excisionase family DNA binding protein
MSNPLSSATLLRAMDSGVSPLGPIAVTVPTAVKLSGIGRTKLYPLIASKEVRSVRVGARRLIDFASLRAFLTSREA